MRAAIILAAGIAIGMAGSAYAQGAAPQPPQGGPAAAQPSGPQTVQSVRIIDIAQLPEAARTQVDAAASKATPEQLKDLHTSIDGAPEIKKALEEKGFKTADVVIANLDESGVLTLIAKKAA